MFPGEISRDFCKTLDQYLPPKPKKPAAPFLRYLKAMKDSIEKEYPEAKYKGKSSIVIINFNFLIMR